MYTCFSQINAFKFTKQRILPLNPLMNIKRSDDIHSNLFCIQAVRRSFSPAILLTSASSKVNALVVSHVLRFTWGVGCLRAMPESVLTCQKRVPHRWSRCHWCLMGIMLLRRSGQGLMREQWEDSVPWPWWPARRACFLERSASPGPSAENSTWCGPAPTLAHNHFHLLGQWKFSKMLFLGFTLFIFPI